VDLPEGNSALQMGLRGIDARANGNGAQPVMARQIDGTFDVGPAAIGCGASGRRVRPPED